MSTRGVAGAQDHPDILLSRIVKHFQNLFDVRSLDGVFAKMNEVYLFVNENKNSFRVLRAMLNLDPGASLDQCMEAIRRLVQSA